MFILDTSEKANHNKQMRRLNSTHCEPWESRCARNDHRVPGARISAGGWMQLRGGRARTPAQTVIEWTSGKKHEWGFGKRPQSSGSRSLRNGELGGGYKDSSEVTLSDQAAHR